MTINHAHLLMHTRPLVKRNPKLNQTALHTILMLKQQLRLLVKRNPKLNQTALHTILMLKQQLRLLVLWPCIHVNGDIA
jgi:uncharacterized protein YneF (UPF0154 family)